MYGVTTGLHKGHTAHVHQLTMSLYHPSSYELHSKSRMHRENWTVAYLNRLRKLSITQPEYGHSVISKSFHSVTGSRVCPAMEIRKKRKIIRHGNPFGDVVWETNAGAFLTFLGVRNCPSCFFRFDVPDLGWLITIHSNQLLQIGLGRAHRPRE